MDRYIYIGFEVEVVRRKFNTQGMQVLRNYIENTACVRTDLETCSEVISLGELSGGRPLIPGGD